MIDKKLEPYYDILFSIFIGIIIILLIHNIYDSPRSVIIAANDKEKFTNIKFPCTDLNVVH
jgi:hypothetical protein